MLDNELPDWQIVELSLALKLRAEDLQRRDRISKSQEIVELRQRIMRSHVVVIPTFATSMLANELGSMQVVEICIALRLRAEYLARRGCFDLCKDIEKLHLRIQESHVILTPFNSI